MAMQYAENRAAAKYDRQATAFLREVVKWEKQADAAPSVKARARYRKKAQKLRKGAIEALESAKLAAATRTATAPGRRAR
jgi:hypothetical protein